MKIGRLIIIGIIIGAGALLAAGCSDIDMQEPLNARREQSAAPDGTDAVVGRIEEINSQIILMTEESDYRVAGIDLTPMVGKKVRVTGTVTEKEGEFTITVRSATEVLSDAE